MLLGQQWPAWDHGEVVVVVVVFVVCLLLMFAVHNMTGSTVSFYFSVVLTAVPLQLDVEK